MLCGAVAALSLHLEGCLGVLQRTAFHPGFQPIRSPVDGQIANLGHTTTVQETAVGSDRYLRALGLDHSREFEELPVQEWLAFTLSLNPFQTAAEPLRCRKCLN